MGTKNLTYKIYQQVLTSFVAVVILFLLSNYCWVSASAVEFYGHVDMCMCVHACVYVRVCVTSVASCFLNKKI
jgi:hypothetical protein